MCAESHEGGNGQQQLKAHGQLTRTTDGFEQALQAAVQPAETGGDRVVLVHCDQARLWEAA